ncbi:zinc finger CCCH-type with G patch domain-containing protein [Copidosoma floridanum]|uniref:zinc finger CCCH-type with G patch domain-containing protein n=1 Tax=Copidosoma floridanum TaxID=29053 RepID=UPI0006C97571|nr:zinc finger CCCH-type with G patch domain-containing protein [Copidosoma floridanum]
MNQYEEQLMQVQEALKTASSSERQGLISLQSDLKELIKLTKENFEGDEDSQQEQTNSNAESKSTLDDEYDLFKAELAQLEEPQNDESSEPGSRLEDELKALEGTKCRAPHGSSWGGTGYHNAMICSVHKSDDDINSLNDIMIRVFFINPTHKEMLPCPYFLDGSCKFSEDQCHFSHGELVPFTSIQEYKEPDYSSIKMGSRVLAKHKNKLWHRCVILKTPDDKNDEYKVKFEASGNTIDVGIDDILPLDDAGLEMSDSSDESDYEQEMNVRNNEEVVERALLSVNSNERLGDWEKHTRGIGSKLMAQMGYITGTGLGRRSDGRVNPVEATVLPAGKSLDHCMTLRENAGGDKNLFSVERKMQKQKKKLEQQRQKEYLREKQREKNNVFNFMNATLGNKSSEPGSSKSKSQKDLKKESNRNLSIANYQIWEGISRLEKESVKLQSQLTRFSEGSVQYNNALLRYNEAQKQMSNLKASEKKITAEQNQRKFKVKMKEF